MAQFYGEMQGNRGSVSRMGSKASGINGHLRGWNIGADVYVYYNEETGKDTVKIYKTSGSSGRKSSELIAEYTE